MVLVGVSFSMLIYYEAQGLLKVSSSTILDLAILTISGGFLFFSPLVVSCKTRITLLHSCILCSLKEEGELELEANSHGNSFIKLINLSQTVYPSFPSPPCNFSPFPFVVFSFFLLIFLFSQ